MIVRNEEKYIERCLKSVLPYVDAVCISDTGSTDRTVDIIKKTVREWGTQPLYLSHDKWVDYSTNRNLVIDKAKEIFPEEKWHLWIDADDVFVDCIYREWIDYSLITNNKADAYLIEHRLGTVSFHRAGLVKANAGFIYYGKCHEALLRRPDDPLNLPILKNCYIECNAGIDFKPKEHYLEHAKLLEGETDARSVYYLAQSYHMGEEWDKAIKTYLKRTSMDGCKEEVYHCWMRLGELCDEPGSYLKAMAVNPTRPEPWFELYKWSKKRNNPDARAFLLEAKKHSNPKGMLIDTALPMAIDMALSGEPE